MDGAIALIRLSRAAPAMARARPLAATDNEDVVLLGLLARGDEVDASYHVHIGTSIIIGVLVAEVIGKPVAILVLIIITIIDNLANREVPLNPAAVLIAIRTEVEGWDGSHRCHNHSG